MLVAVGVVNPLNISEIIPLLAGAGVSIGRWRSGKQSGKFKLSCLVTERRWTSEGDVWWIAWPSPEIRNVYNALN